MSLRDDQKIRPCRWMDSFECMHKHNYYPKPPADCKPLTVAIVGSLQETEYIAR